jgi:hypothetical protein
MCPAARPRRPSSARRPEAPWSKVPHASWPPPKLTVRIVSVLREHYLRPDVPCGAALCEECSDLYGQAPTLTGQSKPSTSKPVLSQAAREPTTAHKSRHYLILDTNILLHQVSIANFARLLSPEPP